MRPEVPHQVQMAILWVFLCVSLFLPNAASSNTAVTPQSLKEDFQSRDIERITESLEDIKSMTFKGQILPFVQDLWETRKDKYPCLPWEVIETEIVKVELADILGQAIMNGHIRLDLTPIHNYLSRLIASPDFTVSRKAIGALSIIGDETDVEKIVTVAKRLEPATFRIAILTLTMMCNEKAASAVAELEASITNSEWRSFILESRRESEDFKNHTDFCRRDFGLKRE